MKTLYQDLMTLCASNDAFSFKDHVGSDGSTYRIFDYRLASWTDFQLPCALWCRGAMFRMNEEDTVLVCLPPKKFFNYSEGNVDHTQSTIVGKMEKLDGSLISSYLDSDGQLRLKSRGSLSSDQAIAAYEWITRPENSRFLDDVLYATRLGFTVNMEYLSPSNRIVVGYETTELRVLGVVDIEYEIGNIGHSGDPFLTECFAEKQRAKYQRCSVSGDDQEKFVSDIYAETEGEGYVLVLERPDGTQYEVKVKNDRYTTLHKAKDSILIKSRLYECVLEGGSDDLRGIFSDDPISMKMIADMENEVYPRFNAMVHRVEKFHLDNQTMERKDYALKAKSEMGAFMSLVMELFIGRIPKYKEFAKKNPSLFVSNG